MRMAAGMRYTEPVRAQASFSSQSASPRRRGNVLILPGLLSGDATYAGLAEDLHRRGFNARKSSVQ